MKKKVKNTDLAIIHWNNETGEIVMLDITNRRVFKRKVQYVGCPKIAVVIYQGFFHFVCNMGKVEYGEIRY
jgi:hypothetical protein